MNLKKKLLTLIICSFIVIFTVSCSCGGSSAEEVKNDATVAAQAETNEKGETVTNAQTQAETQQDDGAVSDDDNTKEENSSNKASDKNNDKNNNSKNSNSEKSDNSNSEKTDSTENQSEDDETADYGEEPLYDAQAVFDEDDFEF